MLHIMFIIEYLQISSKVIFTRSEFKFQFVVSKSEANWKLYANHSNLTEKSANTTLGKRFASLTFATN